VQALIIYTSTTSNTKKVANAIKEGLEAEGIKVKISDPKEAVNEDFFSYDLVCVGSPSIQLGPTKPISDLLKTKLDQYRNQGKILLAASKVPGKNALIFCTYSGPHTGIDEATPAGKTIRQYFEHLGFTIVGEWYVIGEFHGQLDMNTLGRLGDIRGKPTSKDLDKIKIDTIQIAKSCLSDIYG